MFETPLTVVGHIVNNPERRQVGTQEVIKFRVASNSRRRTARRLDRAADRDDDAELAAYNAMLAELARREKPGSAQPR